QAAAQAKTYSGLLQQISNAYGDLWETIGFGITQNEKLLGELTKLRDVLTSGGLVDAVVKLAEVTATVTTKTIEFGQATADTVRGLIAYKDWVNSTQIDVSELEEATGGLTDKFSQLGSVLASVTVGPLLKLRAQFQELGEQARLTAKAEDGIAWSTEQMAKSFQSSVVAILEAEKGVDGLKESIEELSAAQNDEIASSDAFLSSLEKIGVVLESQTNAALEKNNALLREADALYKSGEITRRDFEAIERGIAIANRDTA
ncbi:unnamed protein product, partial [marine sediment metagenome]